VLVVVAAAGWVADRGLRERELDRLVHSMQQEAALVLELAGGTPLQAGDMQELDAVADQAGAVTGSRVTFLATDGSVVGDSAVPLDRLPRVENHADRAEIAAALGGHAGKSTRRSSTIGQSLLYVAVPVDGGRGGAVRIAQDLAQVDAVTGAFRSHLLPAAGVSLLTALAVAIGFSHRSLRPIGALRRLTAAVAEGDPATRLPPGFDDGTIEIARTVQLLAEQLRERLAETTREKERLQAVLDGMSEGVLVVDPEGLVVLVNDPVREFFGAGGDLVGRTPLEGIRHGDLAELLSNAQRKDAPEARVIAVTHPAVRTLRVHAVRFPRGGSAMGTVAVFHDITELTQVEKMRRDFVANASHELRTPLAAIRGFSETLLDSSNLGEADRRSYLEVIDRHARRLGNLIGDLLELSKIESGGSEVELERVDILALTDSLLRDHAARWEESGVAVSRESKGDPLAWADAAAVEQILLNLLDNAVKYTDPGGRVHISIECDADLLTVRVGDTGIGIPPADLGRIFERFYRVDKARSRTLGGTGLGLAIVKHLVQSLCGEISVESELGRASTFCFSLPRAPA
jgi:two-component system phosphate regulon sensor histidine kinase PhoR